ncbi:MAG: MFS transporter [Clostridia bacterium]|nr:MFS transporter [Clostridia bacterium]
MSEEKVRTSEQLEESFNMNQAYMNRLFCTTKERVGYIAYSALHELSLGKYDVGADIWLYKIFGVQPKSLAKATATLTVYDIINDPVSAAIIDNMRTRWGKFKPFQYLAMLPSILSGLYTVFLPLIAAYFNMNAGQKLISYMVLMYFNETVGAFFGGGGYIDNVFTPNPNERTSLLVSANFVHDLINKLPSQILGFLYDLINNGKLKVSFTKVFISFKLVVWIIATVPTIFWYIVSRERVPQSEKPPHPVKGILSVFRNRPLLIYTLTGLIGGIDIGSGEDLYYNDVLNFNMLPTVAGIPGMPISYASYAFAPKFRQRFSTRTLWYFSNGSIFISEAMFFLTGLIGGEKNGFYQKKLPMSIAFALGNCLEMVFYATKGIVGKEINYEVLDYCEWQNGFRVEATINLINGYFTKIKDAILRIINASLLQDWAQYEIGETAVQTQQTKWRLFLIALGPHLIFDFLALIPMIFYNIDGETRERMYMDLEKSRAKRALMEKLERDAEEQQA